MKLLIINNSRVFSDKEKEEAINIFGEDILFVDDADYAEALDENDAKRLVDGVIRDNNAVVDDIAYYDMISFAIEKFSELPNKSDVEGLRTALEKRFGFML